MNYDAIVVGAGIEGSAAAYQLVKKGVQNVLLLEQVKIVCVLVLVACKHRKFLPGISNTNKVLAY